MNSSQLAFSFRVYYRRFFLSLKRTGEVVKDENNIARNFWISVHMGGIVWLHFVMNNILMTDDREEMSENTTKTAFR